MSTNPPPPPFFFSLKAFDIETLCLQPSVFLPSAQHADGLFDMFVSHSFVVVSLDCLVFGALYLYKAGQPCYSRFAAALFSLTTLMLPLVLGLCCAVCTIRLWLYVGLEPITVVLQNFLFSVCRGARGEYFPSLLYYQKDQITAFFFLVLLP